MKKVFVFGIILVLAAYAVLGIVNLTIGVPVAESYANIADSSPEMTRAKEILGAKCIMCHSKNPSLPFYAKLPGASTMLGKHVEDGTRICDLGQLMANAGENEVLLAKLEQSVKLDTMPIPPFMLMHWNGKLNTGEQQDILAWIHQVRGEKFSTGLASAEFAEHPVQPLPDKYPGTLDPKKIELGRLLYQDKRLSCDDTISCASCHDLDKGGTDRAQFSTGVRNQVGGINAPTTFNAMFNVLQFWDGRAKDLSDQAGGPPLNPIEMDTNWEQITGKLSKDAELTALHKEVFGNEEWTDKTITGAIAEFEKTLITPDSAVDRYLKGDNAALTDTEKMGFALFNEHSCITCHAGKAMGGQSFEKPIDPAAYYAFRGIEPGEAEFGRVNATKNEEDRYKLKVPVLRNVALTAPYLHDGNIDDLEEVIRIMNDYFVPELNRKPLAEGDAEKISAMLMKNNGVLNGKQL